MFTARHIADPEQPTSAQIDRLCLHAGMFRPAISTCLLTERGDEYSARISVFDFVGHLHRIRDDEDHLQPVLTAETGHRTGPRKSLNDRDRDRDDGPPSEASLQRVNHEGQRNSSHFGCGAQTSGIAPTVQEEAADGANQ